MLEERVSGGVAESVVVSLEPVEVEDDEEPRVVARGHRESVFELRHQLSTIAQAGERICDRFGARELEQPSVFAERDRESDDH